MKTFSPKGKIHGPIMPQFILQKPITFGAKTMYALLCDYASDKDHCWPSQATLAKRLSCSISSIKNYLGELVREKLISIKREPYRSSVYYLLSPDTNVCTQQPTSDAIQSKVDRTEPKSGSINTLKKQRKEKNSPLSPHMPGETAPDPVRRTCNAPAAGGVSFSLPDFESVWALYPKKDAKGFARIAWLTLSRSGQLPPLSELHATIRRFAASEGWQREHGRFVPHMGNWLRGQRWLDPLPPADQAQAAQNQSTFQALRIREEQEQLRHEREKAENARLRPLFEAFAAKFPPVANDAMPFGIWQYLHSQHRAPSADDVPPGNSLGMVEFLNEFKQRCQTADFIAKHQHTPRGAETPCRPVGAILRGLPAFFPSGEGGGRPEQRFASVYA